jgi:hypothetical protein
MFVSAQWNDRVQERYAPIGRRERQFTRDTTRDVRRAQHWIADIERGCHPFLRGTSVPQRSARPAAPRPCSW